MGDAMSVNGDHNGEGVLLRLVGLHKRYPNGVEAVRSISLEVRRGEVFGLVGPNGAGKSTLLKLIAGLLRPEQGHVFMEGVDVTGRPAEAAHRIGLMPDPLGVYTDISCSEYLRFFARVHQLEGGENSVAFKTAVDVLGLAPWMDAEVESLSAGWQRRLALGRMLLLDAPLLLLDEPAAGLDVRARAELLGIVRRLSEMGRTVVISSHILPELEELADRFGIMDEGKWVQVLTGQTFFDRHALKNGLGGCRWRLQCGRAGDALNVLTTAGTQAVLVDGAVEFTAVDENQAGGFLRAITETGICVTDFRRMDAGLADVVLKVLNGGNGA